MKRPRSRGLRRTVLAVLFPALLIVSAGYPPAFAQDATPAAQPTDPTGVAPQPLTGGRRAQFEAYVASALLRIGVPGASIAVVQGGDVVYFHDLPLSLISEGGFGTVRFEGDDSQPQVLLTILANPTGPKRIFVFASLPGDGTPPP